LEFGGVGGDDLEESGELEVALDDLGEGVSVWACESGETDFELGALLHHDIPAALSEGDRGETQPEKAECRECLEKGAAKGGEEFHGREERGWRRRGI
jgi:hypothetical protein